MRAVVFLVLGCGCASNAPPSVECGGMAYTPYVRTVELAQFPQLRVGGSYDGLDGRDLILTLLYGVLDDTRPVPLEDTPQGIRYCLEVAPSFTAALGSLGPRFAGPGGWVCKGPSGPWCGEPEIEFRVPSDFQPPDVSAALGDDSTSLTIALGDMFVTRTASPVDAPDWTFRAGTQVSFQWSPADDLTSLTSIVLDFSLPTTPEQGYWVDTGFTVTGDTISVTLPSTMIGQGEMDITLSGTINGVSVQQSVVHGATITP